MDKVDTSVKVCEGTVHDPVIVGLQHCNTGKRIRIVHISDTHLKHDEYLPDIPDGDILIHSGDFSHFAVTRFITRSLDYHAEIRQINAFFSKLPHRHKIFIAGNHEMNFHQYSARRTESLLTEVIYLQDSAVTIEGIKVYGSPWNGIRGSSYARGFSVPYEDMDDYWSLIPDDVDVLVTHQPPQDILDGGRHWAGRRRKSHHPNDQYFYLGCQYLRQHVLDRVRPKLHCFGHYHGGNGVTTVDNTVFCNAAMKVHPRPKVIDFYMDPENSRTDLTPVHYGVKSTPGGKCVIS